MKQYHFHIKSKPPLPFRLHAALQLRIDPSRPERGDRLRFYFNRQQIGTPSTCKSSEEAKLWRDEAGAHRMMLDGATLFHREVDEIAREAGYPSPAAFFGDFEKRFGLPFNGVLLRW